MTENSWIPTSVAVPEDERKDVEIRFSDGEILRGYYNDGAWFSGVCELKVREWRPIRDDEAEG